MVKLVLHIGQTKTATTSIQAFLHRSEDLLSSYGCHYLWRPGQAQSHRYLFHLLHLEAFPGDSRLIENRLTRLRDQGVRWWATTPSGICDELWSELRMSFCRLSDGYGLISEELFWHLGGFGMDARNQLLRILRQRLLQFVDPRDLVIVAVLRAHPDWCESWHNQLVKDQGHQDLIRRFATRIHKAGAFCYADNLSSWRTIFPEARLIIRDFHTGLLAGPSGPTLNLLEHLEACATVKTTISSLPLGTFPKQRMLQESIHPFLHHYVMRFKPSYRKLTRYKQLLKRTSRRMIRYSERHFPQQSFTVLPADLQLELRAWSELDPLTADGWMTDALTSRLSTRLLLPKPLPQRAKTICEELLTSA
jgi:hypothetical protein